MLQQFSQLLHHLITLGDFAVQPFHRPVTLGDFAVQLNRDEFQIP